MPSKSYKSAKPPKSSNEERESETKPTTSSGSTNISRSERAGLQFPVGRIHSNLKKGNYAKRIGTGAPIYLTGVIEYLVKEICELAGNAAIDNGKKRISPRHLLMAIKNDEEINKLLAGVTIAQGGVLPNLHPSLLSKRTRERQPGETSSTSFPLSNDSVEEHRQSKKKSMKKKEKAHRMDIDENEE